ncbi:uncharacterized protein A1O9_00808 [Exophiala aquamarina CBS 119918]|uniref:RBR-type E3 ubiquitin transferase n=1 Tax=Exophiala aquamarina CBS 119918 TaxID=1182545 RepID=A0A072Q4L7_9EURO|nr:uncharacterized protein A1O9_00808 [Exophiala aquamarina CBS 119918]KEF62835.1 hypothetical protein A1O9_00808 [Exophiala aquamarina CBS 119918]
MAGDEVKRKKTTHRKHGEHRSSKTRTKPNNDDLTTNPALANGRSPNINALRRARLAHIDNTPEEIPEDMKYVYEKRTKTVAHVSADKGSRRKSTRDHTPERKESRTSHKTTHRTEEQRRVEYEDDSEDEYEYVYSTPGAERSHVDAQPKSSTSRRRRPSTSHSITRKKVETQRGSERSHTEPPRGKTRRRQDDEEIRDNIATSKHERPAVKRSATAPAQPKTEPASSKPPEGADSHSRKPSGMFGGFLLPIQPVPQKKVACLTCGADDVLISHSAKLPCTHRMCHSCLKRIFTMSVKDPAHMPPRCCTEEHIDLKHVDKLFDAKFKVLWNRKFDEYHTKNRIYCPARKCGAWIKPKYITSEKGRKVGRCKYCKTLVCAICSQKMHTTRDCPKDPETKAFVEVAKEAGWQRCYSCSAMVELKEGCNHMTCRCTAEFCMVCGLKWKSCDCPWFNYEAVDAHLGDPAHAQVERDRRRDQETRDEEIARRMQHMVMFDAGTGHNGIFAFGVNAATGNPNLIQQAREALTANYAQAGQAARDLLNNYVIGRDNRPPPYPGDIAAVLQAIRGQPQAQQPPRPADAAAHPNDSSEDAVLPLPSRRGTATRRRNAREADQQRRLQDWANSVAV